MNDQNGRSARFRYAAIGALAALAAVGAVAGTAAALAAKPSAGPHGHSAVAAGAATKTPACPVPDKIGAPQPAATPRAFLNDIKQLVDNGTITATEGQAVDREILAGRVDTDSLASSGFSQSQLQAVQAALSNTKRALASAAHAPK